MAAPGLALAAAPIAETILAAVVAHYGQAAGVPLPARRVIAPGAPEAVAWDCDQLVVTMSGIGVGQAPGEGTQAKQVGNQISAGGLRHAVFAAEIVRCVPESQDGTTPPPAADLTTAGLALIRDAGLLSQALVEACTAVAATIPKGSKAVPGAVTVQGPEGGFASVRGSVAITVGLLA
jgi:hypothetical protein